MLRERATLPLRRRKFVSCSWVWIGMHAPINWFLTRNGKTVKVRDFKKFATRNLGSLAVPFQGWSVIFLPVRSTVVVFQGFSRFLSTHRGNGLHPTGCLPLRRFGSIGDGGFADTETGRCLSRQRRL